MSDIHQHCPICCNLVPEKDSEIYMVHKKCVNNLTDKLHMIGKCWCDKEHKSITYTWGNMNE